ncbi:phospholipid-transporting ATPase 1 [Selaginella moellendorffii]|uniref:phospholipid-transporting ATPase 1 n=1 Tax=Selaginella moellendorffii TaxID=88036 RepID=UPI000D1CCDBD|nr:phospholipid-transporting ATPase 1 [Selaginella moellendorffii]|eukprot:XP_024535631.1 phospholipid-transporting ATPase 1 [Selaginella moellendorffii]
MSRHLLSPSPLPSPTDDPATASAAADSSQGVEPSRNSSERWPPPPPPPRLPHSKSQHTHVSSTTDHRAPLPPNPQPEMLRSRSLQHHSSARPSSIESTSSGIIAHSRSASSQEISSTSNRLSQASSNANTRLRKDPSFRSTRAPSHRAGISRNPSASLPILPVSGKIEEAAQRVIYVNDPGRTNENYEMAGNRVRTSKYTWYSFLPRNLFEQFRRLAYVYFLVIAVLNQIPQLAVFGRTASIIPLAFVLFVTAVKDGYEDWARHKSDLVENNRLAHVFQESEFRAKKWKKIQVGELLKVFANETMPCDLVLLGTSDPSGVAYVQTTNLDGESNLKTRYAHQETLLRHPEDQPINGVVHCEHPNRNIYEFKAYLDLDTDNPTGTRLPLGPNNIVLRGCELKNTQWIVGVAVYTGKETKAMLNSSGAQSKRSKLEQQMNRETLWLSLFLFILCLIGGVGTGVWVARRDDELDMLPYYKRTEFPRSGADDGDKYMYYGVAGEAVIAFLSCLISFQIMIPLSLYISMELVRLAQTFFMVRDTEMLHVETDSRLQCRALNINEDLGQIKYVFSDKTGTLTENMMEFHSASICGVKYAKAGSKASGDVEISEKEAKPGVNADLKSILTAGTAEAEAVKEFFLVLAACNTVVPTWVTQSSSGQLEMEVASAEIEPSGFVEYQGESPDEQALVAAASSYGFTLMERTASSIVIGNSGTTERYEILGIHEFDSVRKRMSVVVECPDKTIKVLVKGADTNMLNIVNISSESQDVRQATLRHLKDFAQDGLRTLVVASKVLGRSEFEKWLGRYSEASTALHDRAEMLQAAAAFVENRLTLIGATGIEDKLQDGVPEAISSLREAGIRVWVLTGDKQETAISIGYSSALLTHDMDQIIINESSKEGCRSALKAAKLKTGGLDKKKSSSSLNIQVTPQAVKKNARDSTLALIIDGTSLVHALSDDLNQELFEVAVACHAVLCCRVAPYQKAAIVSLIKRKDKAMTLSIGDGANDVAMIQMADVGVGISGQEGRQAVMASDFAMPRFRFLNKLLLVHGHWNYQRLAYMVLYNFYRNAVFVMMLFWYILYTAFSSQSALVDLNLIFYSLLFTSVPTIVVAIFDKDLSHKTLLRLPTLYGSGLRHETYNQNLFWLTMLDTLWQSLVLFYVPWFTYKESTIDIWSLGTLWTAAVVILVNLHLALDVQVWNWIMHLAIWGSIAITYIILFIMDSLTDATSIYHYWVIHHAVGTAKYWFDLLLIMCLALLPRFMVKVVKQRWWASDIDIAREAEIISRRKSSPLPREIELQQQTSS